MLGIYHPGRSCWVWITRVGAGYGSPVSVLGMGHLAVMLGMGHLAVMLGMYYPCSPPGYVLPVYTTRYTLPYTPWVYPTSTRAGSPCRSMVHCCSSGVKEALGSTLRLIRENGPLRVLEPLFLLMLVYLGA